MNKHGCDDNGWPLVPVDPNLIPQGYKPVRVSLLYSGDEMTVSVNSCNKAFATNTTNSFNVSAPRLIVTKADPSINFPVSVLPPGWWICNDYDGAWIVRQQPILRKNSSSVWSLSGGCYRVPPWVAATFPKNWLELPLEESAMQQTAKE